MTKTEARVREAVGRGYFVTEDGRLFGPKGELKVSLYGRQRYPTFTTNWGGIVFGLPVHQLAAFQFYGDEAFREDLVVRHLDGDTLNFSKQNILMGTHSQNNLDKPSEVRVGAARRARASQGTVPPNAKLTRDQVLKVRDFYSKLGGKKAPNGTVSALAKDLGVSRSVLHKIRTGEYYESYL